MQNQNANRDALLQALSSSQADGLFSDSKLNELIEAEFSQPVEKMDCEMLDACYQLLERRHSPFTDRQIARSERKGLRKFNRFMKRNIDLKANKSVFQLKPLALVALVVIMIITPTLILNKGFRVSMPPNEQQYIVVGIQQNEAGIARALADRNTEIKTVRLNNVDEIPLILGYQIELPTWMPEGQGLCSIDIAREEHFDEISIKYTGSQGSLYLEVSCYDNRDGTGTSYEQDLRGRRVPLANGATIYLSRNVQTTWGLYQSSHLDYFIEAAGFDEDVILRLFESMGGRYD